MRDRPSTPRGAGVAAAGRRENTASSMSRDGRFEHTPQVTTYHYPVRLLHPARGHAVTPHASRSRSLSTKLTYEIVPFCRAFSAMSVGTLILYRAQSRSTHLASSLPPRELSLRRQALAADRKRSAPAPKPVAPSLAAETTGTAGAAGKLTCCAAGGAPCSSGAAPCSGGGYGGGGCCCCCCGGCF